MWPQQRGRVCSTSHLLHRLLLVVLHCLLLAVLRHLLLVVLHRLLFDVLRHLGLITPILYVRRNCKIHNILLSIPRTLVELNLKTKMKGTVRTDFLIESSLGCLDSTPE
jgi:hypothetical protein